MLKKLIGLISSLWLFGLFSSLQVSSASQPIVLPHNSYNSVSKPTGFSYNSLTRPIYLKVSLSRRQVTLYKGKFSVKSYPIAVGRTGWETPTGNFRVGQMLQNPIWMNPYTGKIIPAGAPDNPLGYYWIGFWTDGIKLIGFHGTPNPESVGEAISHGCIRMYNKDIEELFNQVSLGTLVKVVR